jgi:anti-sigma28 factor (negative regulator of flagellin synthesis)
MDISNAVPMAAMARRMVEESERRAGRIAALREAIAAGTYEVPAAALAEAVVRSMQG